MTGGVLELWIAGALSGLTVCAVLSWLLDRALPSS